MATILIYNNYSGRMESYTRGENQPMPYNTGTLRVSEFRGSSRSSLLWSDLRFIETWNAFRRYYGQPINIGYCFKRIWEGGHSGQSQHYAGGAFDVGQGQPQAVRNRIHSSALAFGGWSFVDSLVNTPTWVHMDRRLSPPACSRGGYIMQRQGSVGVYTLILQDALNAVGISGYTGVDGYFGAGTAEAVRAFQRRNGLGADGVVGCNTWSELTRQALGRGKTSTVLRP